MAKFAKQGQLFLKTPWCLFVQSQQVRLVGDFILDKICESAQQGTMFIVEVPRVVIQHAECTQSVP